MFITKTGIYVKKKKRYIHFVFSDNANWISSDVDVSINQWITSNKKYETGWQESDKLMQTHVKLNEIGQKKNILPDAGILDNYGFSAFRELCECMNFQRQKKILWEIRRFYFHSHRGTKNGTSQGNQMIDSILVIQKI